ncbi:unnamed protein product [Hapterophycus canaliculatus]
MIGSVMTATGVRGGEDPLPRLPGANGAAVRQTLAAGSPGGSARAVAENSAVNGGGSRTGTAVGAGGGAVVDVSNALGKLRPHLKGGRAGSKKFPKACGLLTDLLCAKLGPENEEVFFDVVCHAVACGGVSGGGGAASCSTTADGSSKSAVPGSSGSPESALLRADSVVGEAVRRLVAAAASRSAFFSGRRRERVEAWAKQADGC